MSIANKLVTIAENVNKVYEAGKEASGGEFYDKGYGDGYEAGYNKAESENPLYYSTTLNNIFAGAVFPDGYESIIKVKKAPQTSTYIYHQAIGLKKSKLISDDNTGLINFNHSHRTTTTPTLVEVDLTKYNTNFATFQETFRGQKKLESIDGAMNLSQCTNVSNAFTDCNALEDIEFVPNTIPISISFNTCNKLTHDSLMSIINGLAVVSTTQTLTLGTTNLAKLTTEEKAIATEKGWSLL